MTENNERVVEPGEQAETEDLLITIVVSPLGEAQLAVNRDAVPVEVLHFYLQFMSNALMARHQMNIAQAKQARDSLVLPKTDLVIPR